jgi:hypothetical protein
MLFLPPTKVNNLGFSSATYSWAMVTRESCKVLLPPMKLLYVGRWILLEGINPDNCGETGRTSFSERRGVAYFFGDCFFCGLDSALGVLLVGFGEAVPNNGPVCINKPLGEIESSS